MSKVLTVILTSIKSWNINHFSHATFLVKNTLFNGEIVWQPLKELQSCSSSILVPPTRAFKWSIVCLSAIITFEDTSSFVKKCPFLLYKINVSWHNYIVGGTKKLEEQLCSSFRDCHATSPLKKCIFYKKGCVTAPNRATQLSLTYFDANIKG